MSKTICIIGAGTYGSYLAHAVSEKYKDVQIHLFEVGNKQSKSETEAGFLSEVNQGEYKGTSHGRYFGLGGTSAKWGGQLLFFSQRDFSNPGAMKEVVECNLRYKNKVLRRFFENIPVLEDKEFEEGLFIKQGIWLKFSQRNLYKHFQISKRANIKVHQNIRVVKINSEGHRIKSITVLLPHQQTAVEFHADIFYLTSGAFESLRLLHASNFIDLNKKPGGFSDHITLRCFELSSKVTRLAAHDFRFRFVNGSMITARLVGETDNVSFYIHPIFNENFKFFQFLKQVLFKGKFSLSQLFQVGKQALFIVPFVYHYLVNKKLYLYGSWYINIDIELSNSKNSIQLLDKLDQYNQNGLNLTYHLSNDTVDKILAVKQKVKKMLMEADVKFREIDNSTASSFKSEDVYHPYGLFSYLEGKTIYDVYNPVKNLFLFNTGLLQRSGGINPTASVFCLIEYHVERVLNTLISENDQASASKPKKCNGEVCKELCLECKAKAQIEIPREVNVYN